MVQIWVAIFFCLLFWSSYRILVETGRPHPNSNLSTPWVGLRGKICILKRLKKRTQKQNERFYEKLCILCKKEIFSAKSKNLLNQCKCKNSIDKRRFDQCYHMNDALLKDGDLQWFIKSGLNCALLQPWVLQIYTMPHWKK